MTDLQFTFLLEKDDDGGYTARCLELKGVYGQGETEEEALKEIQTALNIALNFYKEKIQSKRGVLLANFYEQIVTEQVGNMLQDITEKIDKGKTKKHLDTDLKKLEHLLDHWKPIFEKYYPSAIPTIFLSLRNR